jgi:hypothetical protein
MEEKGGEGEERWIIIILILIRLTQLTLYSFKITIPSF